MAETGGTALKSRRKLGLTLYFLFLISLLMFASSLSVDMLTQPYIEGTYLYIVVKGVEIVSAALLGGVFLTILYLADSEESEESEENTGQA